MKINCYVQINAKGNPFDNTEGDVPVFFDKESAIVVDENINIKKAILIWGNDKNEVDQLQEKLLSQSKQLENIRQIEKPIIEELLRTKLENSLIKKNFDVMVGNDSRQQEEIERLKGLIETEFKGVWIEDRFNSFIYAEYGETIATERANELWQQFKKKNKL